jgi:ferredoxin
MKYLPQVDEGICAAHGDCVEIAPTVFALNDVAHVIGDGAPETILEAAEACPSAPHRDADCGPAPGVLRWVSDARGARRLRR